MAFRINCQQCGREAFTPGFSWKVSDQVWHLAGYKQDDVVCLECFGNRLREKFGIQGESVIELIDKATGYKPVDASKTKVTKVK